MVVFPVKWLPWLLLIGGLILIFSGEATFFSIVLMIIGGVLVYMQLTGKKSGTSTNNNRTNNYNNTGINNTVVNDNTTSTVVTHETSLRCPSCGNVENDDMNYCSKCGTRLR
jgi:hypothetical protein